MNVFLVALPERSLGLEGEAGQSARVPSGRGTCLLFSGSILLVGSVEMYSFMNSCVVIYVNQVSSVL